MRESDIERRFVEQVSRIGGKALKFISPGASGVPDRIVLFKGQAYFVEVKAPGKKLRPIQQYQAKELKKYGFSVSVIDSLDGIVRFIRQLEIGGDPFHG